MTRGIESSEMLFVDGISMYLTGSGRHGGHCSSERTRHSRLGRFPSYGCQSQFSVQPDSQGRAGESQKLDIQLGHKH